MVSFTPKQKYPELWLWLQKSCDQSQMESLKWDFQTFFALRSFAQEINRIKRAAKNLNRL